MIIMFKKKGVSRAENCEVKLHKIIKKKQKEYERNCKKKVLYKKKKNKGGGWGGVGLA